MDIKNFAQAKAFKIVIKIIVGMIVILLVFKLGMAVGFKKAGFSYRWGENYSRNFGGPKGGFFGNFKDEMGDRNFIGAHGVFGKIIKIDNAIVAIKGQDGVERAVLIKDDTAIKRGMENIKLSDFKIDDSLVVIGEPNDAGQIEAKLIRLMPAPPAGVLPMPPMGGGHGLPPSGSPKF
jgi:hypothetical protein